MAHNTALHIDGKILASRLFLGTAGYPSPRVLAETIEAAQPGLITVSLRRESKAGRGQDFWQLIKGFEVPVLPNTAGCYSAAEAITTAEMAREFFETNWIKLEVIADDYTLAPEPTGLLEAAEKLVDKGFTVFPYMTDDQDLAQKLSATGCTIFMPWGAPIGSAQGLKNIPGLQTLRNDYADHTLVIDAGLGAPSHAAHAMELGYDAVLLNTAVAKSPNPADMGAAFAAAIKAGRKAFLAGLVPQQGEAAPSTPMIDRPFWHQNHA